MPGRAALRLPIVRPFFGAILKVNSTAGAAHGAGQVPYNRGSRDQAAQGLYGRGARPETSPLLGPCVTNLPNQSSVHDGKGASHHALGAQGGCRGSAGKVRQKSGCHAHAP